jgi:CheY-like chemotaxis protein
VAKGKILVVEDAQLFRAMYEDKLKMEGYEVWTAADGLEGLKLAREVIPDLILLDLVMPRMGGLEVLKRLKSDPRTKDIPVVVLSNLEDAEGVKEAIEQGAEDFLRKTASSPAEVTAKIKKLVTLRLLKKEGKEEKFERKSFKLAVRDKEFDADGIIQESELPHRFWCPACQIELVLELIPEEREEAGHWYKAHFVCPQCGRGF